MGLGLMLKNEKKTTKGKKKQQLMLKQEMQYNVEVQLSCFKIYMVVGKISHIFDGRLWIQMVCNDNTFMSNVNCVDAFQWAVYYLKGLFSRQSLKTVLRS